MTRRLVCDASALVAVLLDAGRHHIIESADSSPLLADNGFFGCRPFSQINAALRAGGAAEIDWRLAGEKA